MSTGSATLFGTSPCIRRSCRPVSLQTLVQALGEAGADILAENIDVDLPRTT